MIAAPRVLGESKSPKAGSFNALGALLVTAGLALLVYAFVDAVDAGWGSSTTLTRILASLVLLAAFVVAEARQETPLVPLSIFRLRTLRGANVVGLLIGMSLFSMFLFFFLSLYLQSVLQYSAIKSGLAFLPLAVTIIISAGAGSALVTRIGFKPTLATGTLFIAAWLAWFSRIDPNGSFGLDVLGPSIFAAIGFGLSFVSRTIAAVTGTEPHEAGLASRLINTSQQIGGAVGLAILASIASSSTQSSGDPSPAAALTTGFSDAFLVGSGIALVGALLALVLISSQDSRERAGAARDGEVR